MHGLWRQQRQQIVEMAPKARDGKLHGRVHQALFSQV